MRRTADRPLTDAEERTLAALADARDEQERGHPGWTSSDGYTRPAACRNVTTLDSLADRGLVKTRERPTTTVARITDKGYALIRSTGD